jgi:hypothetical protein
MGEEGVEPKDSFELFRRLLIADASVCDQSIAEKAAVGELCKYKSELARCSERSQM